MNVVLVRDQYLVLRSEGIECGLTVGSELVMQSGILLSVLRELKETRGVVIKVGVTEIVELASKGILNELLLLSAVLGLVHVELARG